MSHEANIFIFCVASCMWNLSLTSLTSTKQRLRKTCLLLLYSYPKLAFWMCLSALQQVWLNGHLCLLRLREWFLGKQIDSQIICTSSHHSLGKNLVLHVPLLVYSGLVHLLEWYPFWCEYHLGQTAHQPSADTERKPKNATSPCSRIESLQTLYLPRWKENAVLPWYSCA